MPFAYTAVGGAGLSGLAAARAVAASGLSVLVIGLAIVSGDVPPIMISEGGEWSRQEASGSDRPDPRIYQLAAELGVDTFPGKAAEGKHVP